MAGALADRAEGAEKAELQQLIKRLVRAFGDDLGGQKIVELLVDQLVAVGEEAAEEALGELVGMYRHRRKEAGGGSWKRGATGQPWRSSLSCGPSGDSASRPRRRGRPGWRRLILGRSVGAG